MSDIVVSLQLMGWLTIIDLSMFPYLDFMSEMDKNGESFGGLQLQTRSHISRKPKRSANEMFL